MIIKDKMNFGLYGQILTWVLETLQYLDENNLKPKWEITSPFYGNIFGKYILLNYIPDTDNEVVTLSSLKKEHGIHLGDDFERANKLWNKFFKFSPEVINGVDEFTSGLDMGKTIGIHYRGTDKINTEGGYINTDSFLKIVDDYLLSNDIDNIIIFTDEKKCLLDIKNHYKDKYNIVYDNDLLNSDNKDILFFNNIKNNVNLDEHYIKALNDMLVLSKCSVIFKTASQLSAWPKIINPNIEAYRISSFKYDWFPDSRIPLYESSNPNIKDILNNLYKKEYVK